VRNGSLGGVRCVFVLSTACILSGCAGRDPHPVAVVQPQDAQSDCAMIRAEIEANNVQAKKLAEENHAKIAQNVAAGVVGVVVWPVWFAMDAKGAEDVPHDVGSVLDDLVLARCLVPPQPRWEHSGKWVAFGPVCGVKALPLKYREHPSRLGYTLLVSTDHRED
jgi:hypothetical protein